MIDKTGIAGLFDLQVDGGREVLPVADSQPRDDVLPPMRLQSRVAEVDSLAAVLTICSRELVGVRRGFQGRTYRRPQTWFVAGRPCWLRAATPAARRRAQRE